jgi:hypothetical protein
MQIGLLLKHIDFTPFVRYTIDTIHHIPFDQWVKINNTNVYRTTLNGFSIGTYQDRLAPVDSIQRFMYECIDDIRHPYWIINLEKILLIRSYSSKIQPTQY